VASQRVARSASKSTSSEEVAVLAAIRYGLFVFGLAPEMVISKLKTLYFISCKRTYGLFDPL
jgi:hypothetical protein